MVLHTTYVLRVPYSCGVVLGFLVLAGNSFSVTYVLSVQYSSVVVSVFCCCRKVNLVYIFLLNSNFLLVHRNKLSVNVYLFLAVFGSTIIQPRLFLKNIEIFV